MVEPVFGGCRKTQNIRRLIAVRGDDPSDLGAFARQRAGFVEQHGVDFAQQI